MPKTKCLKCNKKLEAKTNSLIESKLHLHLIHTCKEAHPGFKRTYSMGQRR